jgi:exonuclease III
VGNFTTPLSPIYRSSKQKIYKEILKLHKTIDQMYLTDVCRIYHPTTEQYTFFSGGNELYPK